MSILKVPWNLFVRGPTWLFNTDGHRMQVAGPGWEYYNNGTDRVINETHDNYSISR